MSNKKSTNEKKATSENQPSSGDDIDMMRLQIELLKERSKSPTASSNLAQSCGALIDITKDQVDKIKEHKAQLTDICLSEDMGFEKKRQEIVDSLLKFRNSGIISNSKLANPGQASNSNQSSFECMFLDIAKKTGNNLSETTSALNFVTDVVQKITEPAIKYDEVLESICGVLKNIPPKDEKAIEEAIERIKLILL
jgi:hypothetical protein